MSDESTSAAEFLKRWVCDVNTGDVDDLAGLYDVGAVLIPTFSNRLLNTPARIRDYFEKLASCKELTVAVHENTLSTRPVTGMIASLCGIYCWRFAVDGELLTFEARFSYLLDFSRPAPILQHHSSQVPRMLQPPAP